MSAKITHIGKKKTLAPKLRFKNFDGKWNSITIRDHVISSAFGPRFSSDLYSDSGNVLTLRTTDMDNDGNICYDKVPLAKLNLDELKEHILLKGDLVISRSGTIGVTGIFLGYPTPVIPGAFLIRFRFKKDELSPDFVRLYFNCSKGRKEIESLSAGGVQKNLTGSSVLKMAIVVPSLPEQQKIASFLSAVDEKIQQLTRKKELLEQYKKGVMQQLFSGKLRFKDENGKAFPKWEEKRLGEYLIYKSERNEDIKVELVLSVSNKKGFITQDEQFDGYTVASKDLSNYKIVYKNEIAYNPSRINVGSIARLNNFEKGIVSPMYIVFALKDELDSVFFENQYATHRFKHLIKVGCSGSVRDSLNFEDLANFKLNFPSIQEQKKIANYLSNIDIKIESVTKQISQTQTFKKGLLQQMFV